MSSENAAAPEVIKYEVTPIEGARIIACLEEAIEKLSFLNTLTPDVLAHRDELSNLVSDEVTTLINEQRNLEQEFNVIYV
jgi:hypothetical protein